MSNDQSTPESCNRQYAYRLVRKSDGRFYCDGNETGFHEDEWNEFDSAEEIREVAKYVHLVTGVPVADMAIAKLETTHRELSREGV